VHSLSGPIASLLELLFPIRCAGCDRRGVNLCEPCRPSIPWLGTDVCPLCASPSRLARICRPCDEGRMPLDGARAACRFEGVARKAIHDLKFRRVRGRAELLGDWLAEAVERRHLAIDLLVPIPLAPGRLRTRGFNQSELIARRLGDRVDVPVFGTCLERVRETPPQVGRSMEERRANVIGAFACREPSLAEGRRICLVDDVMTTGATMRSCAEALRASGAARVFGLVVARGL
jgi:competence protein ComFC